MTSKEIKDIIAQEINNNYDLSNAHGVDLRTCLIEPTLDNYIDSFNEKSILKLWTVLEETPDKEGYKIVFDANNKTFGLGILTEKNESMFIGYYGSFLETLEGM